MENAIHSRAFARIGANAKNLPDIHRIVLAPCSENTGEM
jgi:hypothetical protein